MKGKDILLSGIILSRLLLVHHCPRGIFSLDDLCIQSAKEAEGSERGETNRNREMDYRYTPGSEHVDINKGSSVALGSPHHTISHLEITLGPIIIGIRTEDVQHTSPSFRSSKEIRP